MIFTKLNELNKTDLMYVSGGVGKKETEHVSNVAAGVGLMLGGPGGAAAGKVVGYTVCAVVTSIFGRRGHR